jgi:isopenicillin-N epimerase
MHDEFDWTGTEDPTAFLCVPKALEVVGGLVPGGWDEVRRRNRALALEARDILCAALGVEPPAPDDMVGFMAAVPLSDERPEDVPTWALSPHPLQERLLARFGVEVPITPWPAPGKRLVRVSAQLYNHRAEYERLAEGLRALA